MDYDKMDRAELIQTAVRELKKSRPDFDEKIYDRIIVRKSLYGKVVAFSFSIKYMPLNSCFVYGASIILGAQQISFDITPNPMKTPDWSAPFFRPDAKSKKAIKFVTDAINKSGEIGHFDELPESTNMTITEHKDFYHIDVDSPGIYSFYNVKKKTGEIYDAGHKHKMIDPDENLD